MLAIECLESQHCDLVADLQVLRVFHDRLISAEDKAIAHAKVAELVQRR